MKRHPKKGNQHFFPEAVHLHVAKQREVVEFALLRQSDRAPDDIRLEAHIGIGKQKPLAIAGFKSLLKSVRFSEPAIRNLGNVHRAKTRMRRREIVENAARGILRAVVDGDDFELRIVERG